LGYIDRFKEKNGHDNPNSTDIHSLKSVQNPSAYITKYMTKADQERKMEGRVWGSSKNLTKVNSFQGYAVDFEQDIQNGLNSGVDCFESEYFTIFNTWRGVKKTVESLLSKENFSKISIHYIETFKFLYDLNSSGLEKS
jgi:NDP-sugar pyrophosphorylase family protein